MKTFQAGTLHKLLTRGLLATLASPTMVSYFKLPNGTPPSLTAITAIANALETEGFVTTLYVYDETKNDYCLNVEYGEDENDVNTHYLYFTKKGNLYIACKQALLDKVLAALEKLEYKSFTPPV